MWFDQEGDFLELSIVRKKGYFRQIGPDVYERVDMQGRVIGFAVFNFLKHDREPVEIPWDLSRLTVG
ncbi:MAG: DUF2283 domain-containing protein [Armatimonadetes bacterium]|nr:DUF2283 domain-containing protein [Armatimonadota bacterium]